MYPETLESAPERPIPGPMTEDEYLEWLQESLSSLELLYPDVATSPAKVDIVLVAGLGGHHTQTWTSKEDGTFWPRDLLQQALPNVEVRVLSFRYNTTLRGTTSKSGIRDHANDLLAKLHDEREDDMYAKLRRLVFVGHSLGGMIIKRAMTAAHLDVKYRSIWEASIGIVSLILLETYLSCPR